MERIKTAAGRMDQAAAGRAEQAAAGRAVSKENNLGSRRRELVLLLVLLAAGACIIYWNYLNGNYRFLFHNSNNDTANQYFPSIMSTVQKLRDGDLSFWDATMGYGLDITNSASWVFDLFNVPVYLAGIAGGTGAALWAVLWMQILKAFLVGIFVWLLLGELGFYGIPAVAGAYASAFCGYMMGWGEHYFFASGTVLFVALIWRIERCLNRKKGYWILAVQVGITLAFSLYMSIMIAIGCLIYLLFRLVSLAGREGKRAALREFGRMILTVLCGAFLSAVISLPAFWQLTQVTERLNHSEGTGAMIRESFALWLAPSRMQEVFIRLVSNNLYGTQDFYQGNGLYTEMIQLCFSSFWIIFLAIYFTENIFYGKKKRQTIVLLAGFVFSLALPVTTLIFDLFENRSTRYTFVLIPFAAYVIAWTLTRIRKIHLPSLAAGWIMAGFVILFVRRYHVKLDQHGLDLYVHLIYAAEFLMMLLLSAMNDSVRRIAARILRLEGGASRRSAAVAKTATVTEMSQALVESGRQTDGDTEQSTCICDSDKEESRQIHKNGGGQRTDKTVRSQHNSNDERKMCVGRKAGIQQTYNNERGVRSGDRKGIRHGFLSLAVLALIAASTVADAFYSLNYETAWTSGEAAAAAGAKSATEELLAKIPEKEQDFFRVEKMYEDVSVWNDSLLQNYSGVSYYNTTYNKYIVRFVRELWPDTMYMKKLGTNYVTYRNDGLNMRMANLLGIRYILTDRETGVDLPGFEKIAETADGHALYRNESDTGFGTLYRTAVPESQIKDLDTEARQELLEHAVILSDEDAEAAGIEEAEAIPGSDESSHSFGSEIKPYKSNKALPQEMRDNSCIEADAKSTAVRSQVHVAKGASDGEYSAEVQSEGNGILLLPIAFDSGWKAYIDGKQSKLYCADFGFMGIVIPNGEHTVQITYHTPMLHMGLALTICGAAALLLYAILFSRIKEKLTRQERK